MRDAISQKIHDAMISRLAGDLKQRGYGNLRADHIRGYIDARPERVYCQVAETWLCPDLTAEKDGRQVIFEVETEDSIDSPVTKREISTFAAHAAENDCLFYLVVPDNEENRAQALLQGLGKVNPRKAFVLGLDL